MPTNACMHTCMLTWTVSVRMSTADKTLSVIRHKTRVVISCKYKVLQLYVNPLLIFSINLVHDEALIHFSATTIHRSVQNVVGPVDSGQLSKVAT